MASSRQVESTRKLEVAARAKATGSWSLADDREVLKETGYELLKKIGHGSFAKVWKAKSLKMRKDLAIKIIYKPQASVEYVERFLPRELSIIQKLKHKNLIRFYEILETWHSVYIVMELAEKGTVADLIERRKFIPENQARRFYSQLLDVVEYCHLNGVVHRDIKCENLLLDKESNLLLTDFGFAKQDVYPLASGRFKPSRTFCGSYAYAPPEILANKPYNPCLADVWCMGMVLYTMLFGMLPYKHQNMKALIAAKRRPPQFPDLPYVTPKAKKFLLLMLTTEPERATITALRSDQWFNIPKTLPMVFSSVERIDEIHARIRNLQERMQKSTADIRSKDSLPSAISPGRAQMKRFSWLPGLRPLSIHESSLFQRPSILSSNIPLNEQSSQIEDKSTTTDLSEMLENRISIELSQNSSSDMEATVLTSRIA